MLYLASDHAGFDLKNDIKQFLEHNNIQYEDIGPHEYIETDDYPDFCIPAAQKVAENPENRGIILGMSGQGEAMAANKVRGIRCAVYYGGPDELIKLSREHNNANMLSFGAKFMGIGDVKRVLLRWLKLPFSNEERHVRRINKIADFER